MKEGGLPPALFESVLSRLDLKESAPPNPVTLARLYRAWCDRVPFDNLLKRYFFASGGKGALPGTTAQSFFASWLEHGTGGTCWSGSIALHALLEAFGFAPTRVLGMMMPNPNVKTPNHGTVAVELDGTTYILDSAMLSGVPIPLREGPVSKSVGGIQVERVDGFWHLLWLPLHRTEKDKCFKGGFGAAGGVGR